MAIERQKCIDWLMKNKLYYCCENPMWSFSDSQDGNIRAVCEYCGHEIFIPISDLS